MGTNYYMLNGKPPCKDCGRPFEDERHIGKSSGGWCFSLRVYPDQNIKTLADWLPLLCAPGVTIRDEYGKAVELGDLLRTIAGRRGRYRDGEDFRQSWLQENHAVPGPFGLARSQIDGRHCIGHGEGTWDYFPGEFS
jgi:hypothetical protein